MLTRSSGAKRSGKRDVISRYRYQWHRSNFWRKSLLQGTVSTSEHSTAEKWAATVEGLEGDEKHREKFKHLIGMRESADAPQPSGSMEIGPAEMTNAQRRTVNHFKNFPSKQNNCAGDDDSAAACAVRTRAHDIGNGSRSRSWLRVKSAATHANGRARRMIQSTLHSVNVHSVNFAFSERL